MAVMNKCGYKRGKNNKRHFLVDFCLTRFFLFSFLHTQRWPSKKYIQSLISPITMSCTFINPPSMAVKHNSPTFCWLDSAVYTIFKINFFFILSFVSFFSSIISRFNYAGLRFCAKLNERLYFFFRLFFGKELLCRVRSIVRHASCM